MTIHDCVLIEELPAGCKLFYRNDGSVVIAGGSTNESRTFYAIKPLRNLRERSCLVQRMAAGTSELENVAPVGGVNGLDPNYEYQPLLAALFPTVDEASLNIFDQMTDELAWEIADCFTKYPNIQARHYPVQYIALLLWCDDRPAQLHTIEQQGGNITAQHLCIALGIPKLTNAMKQLIICTQPGICKATFVQSIRRVLQGWDECGHVFAGMKNLTLDPFELEAIIEGFQQYPALLRARWFRVTTLQNNDCLHYDWADWLQRAYDYVIERHKRKTSTGIITGLFITFDHFLCSYIHNCQQLKRLIRLAEIEFTEHSDTWLQETYADNQILHTLPIEVNSDHFRRLSTAGELRDIAKSLSNCAAGYLNEAVNGYTVFFAYKYDPDDCPWGPLFDELPHEEIGLLALRGSHLQQWVTTGEAPDWQIIIRHLIMEFKGVRNAEMSQTAWSHLEDFLAMSVNNAVIAYRNRQC